MATGSISCTIPKDANYPNLKEVSLPQMRREVADLFAPGEEAVQCFQTIRDQVVFTNKRVFIVNAQGVTGKKVSYFSYPYSKVQYFGFETAGILDVDSELLLLLPFSAGGAGIFMPFLQASPSRWGCCARADCRSRWCPHRGRAAAARL